MFFAVFIGLILFRFSNSYSNSGYSNKFASDHFNSVGHISNCYSSCNYNLLMSSHNNYLTMVLSFKEKSVYHHYSLSAHSFVPSSMNYLTIIYSVKTYSYSLNPSLIPSPIPSLIPSLTPSLMPSPIPSLMPSLMPSHIPSLIPSLMPSPMPSLNPSLIPSLMPSPMPSLNPSLMPSPMPSLNPSLIPSLMPSPMPSPIPSLIPSLMPSPIPSLIPSLNPSLMPSYSINQPILLFESALSLSGLTKPELDNSAQTAVMIAMSQSMNISLNFVKFISQKLAIHSFHAFLQSQTYTIVATTEITIPLSKTENPTLLYESLKTKLIESVENGNFNTFLVVASIALNSTSTQNAVLLSVELTDPIQDPKFKTKGSQKYNAKYLRIFLITVFSLIGIVVLGIFSIVVKKKCRINCKNEIELIELNQIQITD